MLLTLKSFFVYLPRKRKLELVLLSFLGVISSILEIVSIGSIIPFLTAITDPDVFLRSTYIEYINKYSFLKINSNNYLLLLTIFFILSILLASSIRIVLIVCKTRVSHNIGIEIAANLYENILKMPYSWHKDVKSNEIIALLTSKIDLIIYSILIPLITLLTDLLIIFGVIIFLIMFGASTPLQVMGVFIFAYLLILTFIKKKIRFHADKINFQSPRVVKIIKDALSGIRDVLIDGTYKIHSTLFQLSNGQLKQSLTTLQVMNQIPKYILEAFFMVIVICFSYELASRSEFLNFLPLFGALALSAQRLLPLLQEAYASYSVLSAGEPALKDVTLMIDQTSKANFADRNEELIFEKNIRLVDVSFRYTSNSNWILRHINLEINKGDCLGFIGPTGSGKSTLLDILMGLLKPTEGFLEVDGVKIDTEQLMSIWRQKISHVPQSIFIADITVEKNIAFGVKSSNNLNEKIVDAAIQAQIHNDIISWELGYQTTLGERGTRLSGGQLQRIGLARAFYRGRDLLVLDEATSALDETTESQVIEAIHGSASQLTILMVAHRTNTLNKCTHKYEVSKGSLKKIVN